MKARWAPIKGGAENRPENRNGRAGFVMALGFNLVPLAGVAFWGWSPFELIFLYWLENVVIGARTLMMILLSGRSHGRAGAAAIGAFFTFHYGLFCFVHGIFVVVLFGGPFGSNPFNAIPTGPAIQIGLLAMIVWQTGVLLLHVASGDASSPIELMNAPYPRIVALHLTIIFGGYLLMLAGWPHAGVIILAVIKTAIDAGVALKSATPAQTGVNGQARAVNLPSSRPRP